MPPKPSEDMEYARDLGMSDARNGAKIIARLGGAAKLRALSPEVRNLLLEPARFGNNHKPKTGKK